MLKEERYSRIMGLLKEKQMAKLSEMAELTGVSTDTIRRDLEKLEEYGVLKRIRGGAVAHNINLDQHVYEMRSTVHVEEKETLAKLIDNTIEDGTTIALGCSSTIVTVAKHLAANYTRLTVITNGIEIMRELSANPNFKIIFLGGVLDVEENATYGKYCEDEIYEYNVDACIISASGISPEKGLSDFRINQVNVIRKIMDISQRIIVAVDNSIFETVSCLKLCDFSDIDCIITNDKLSGDIVEKLRENNVELITP